MKTLKDTPQLRSDRERAYAAGEYRFPVPPVSTQGWDSEAWMNFVHFNNPKLTGFLPYTTRSQRSNF